MTNTQLTPSEMGKEEGYLVHIAPGDSTDKATMTIFKDEKVVSVTHDIQLMLYVENLLNESDNLKDNAEYWRFKAENREKEARSLEVENDRLKKALQRIKDSAECRHAIEIACDALSASHASDES